MLAPEMKKGEPMTVCGVCSEKVGMLQSALQCSDCGTYMHFDCAVERRDGYYCPNCSTQITSK
jgi:hypothetical protein